MTGPIAPEPSLADIRETLAEAPGSYVVDGDVFEVFRTTKGGLEAFDAKGRPASAAWVLLRGLKVSPPASN